VGASADRSEREAVVRVTSPRYFDVMRIALIVGRGFDEPDTQTAPTRAVVSKALAQQVFQTVNVVGRPLWVAALGRSVEIAGVVGDVKHRALDEAVVPTLYLAVAQQPSRSSHVVVRAGLPLPDVIREIREEVERLDGSLPVYGARRMDDVVSRSPGVPTRRVAAACFGVFAVLALVIAAAGVFGVVSHDVTRRRPELALRVALGADPRKLQWFVLRQAVLVMGIGLAGGIALLASTSTVLTSVITDARAMDPATLLAVSSILSILCIVVIVPALGRAVNTDPMTVFRESR
jgi:hypothetical protein